MCTKTASENIEEHHKTGLPSSPSWSSGTDFWHIVWGGFWILKISSTAKEIKFTALVHLNSLFCAVLVDYSFIPRADVY